MLNHRITEKIRKLIAHEQSARSINSLPEADAFAAKIQSLCDEYRVGLLEVSQGEIENLILRVCWRPEENGHAKRFKMPKWLRILAEGLATGHACKLLFTSPQVAFFFVGTETDANVANAMFNVLVIAALDAYANSKQSQPWLNRSSFLTGFALGVCEQYHQRHAAAAVTPGTQALTRTIDLAIERNIQEFKNAKPITIEQPDASQQRGYQAGMSTSLETRALRPGTLALSASAQICALND